jgi:hypothetical protein
MGKMVKFVSIALTKAKFYVKTFKDVLEGNTSISVWRYDVEDPDKIKES